MLHAVYLMHPSYSSSSDERKTFKRVEAIQEEDNVRSCCTIL